MTVSAPAKLEALERAFRTSPQTADATASATAMHSSGGKRAQAMEPEISNVRRAVRIYYEKIPVTERSVLTVGIDAAGINRS